MKQIFETFTLAAGASQAYKTGAAVMTVKTCTLPALVSFGGQQAVPMAVGNVVQVADSNLVFSNPNASAITIGVWFGDKAVPFSPADNSSSNASTYLFGNCGIANSGNANLPKSGGGTTNVTCDANGYLSIANNVNVQIVNTNNGHRRQMLVLSIAASTVSAVPLNVLDNNLNTFMTIPPNSPPVALPTDSVVYLNGAGGAAKVTVGEMYLNS